MICDRARDSLRAAGKILGDQPEVIVRINLRTAAVLALRKLLRVVHQLVHRLGDLIREHKQERACHGQANENSDEQEHRRLAARRHRIANAHTSGTVGTRPCRVR